MFKREILSYDGDTGKAIVQTPISGKIEGAVLFEHGVGEKYKDDKGNIVPIEKLETLALPKFVKSMPSLVPNFLYVFPQCNSSSWSETVSMKVLKFFDMLCAKFNIEERHCTGLSMGGYGTFWMAKYAYAFNGLRHGYFKSYGVICGRGDNNSPSPVFEGSRWKVWHGTQDDSAHTYQYGINLFGIIAANGVKEKEFHAYPGAKHNIWDQVYNPDPSNVDGYFAWLRKGSDNANEIAELKSALAVAKAERDALKSDLDTIKAAAKIVSGINS